MASLNETYENTRIQVDYLLHATSDTNARVDALEAEMAARFDRFEQLLSDISYNNAGNQWQ